VPQKGEGGEGSQVRMISRILTVKHTLPFHKPVKVSKNNTGSILQFSSFKVNSTVVKHTKLPEIFMSNMAAHTGCFYIDNTSSCSLEVLSSIS
jgi:hypothetical protein